MEWTKMFFQLEWNIRNQRHDKIVCSVFCTYFLLTTCIYGTYVLSTGNFIFLPQTTWIIIILQNRHKYSQGPTQQRYDMEKKFLSSVLFVYTLSLINTKDRERDIRPELSHLCVCVCVLPAPRKKKQTNWYQFSMRYLWNVISSFYLLLLLLECMQARSECIERTRDLNEPREIRNILCLHFILW